MAARSSPSSAVRKRSGIAPVFWAVVGVVIVLVAALAISPAFRHCLGSGGAGFDLLGRPLLLVCGVHAIDENHDLAIVLATIVLAVFTVSLWAATNALRQSTDELRNSTDALWVSSERAMVISNRAWVFTQPWPETTEFQNSGDILIHQMELHCTGNSPATVTELYVGFRDQEPFDDVASYPEKSIKQVYNLAVGDRWPHKDKFRTTDARPFVYGYVRYTDAFGNERESRYCYRLTNSEKIGFRTAGGPAWSKFT